MYKGLIYITYNLLQQIHIYSANLKMLVHKHMSGLVVHMSRKKLAMFDYNHPHKAPPSLHNIVARNHVMSWRYIGLRVSSCNGL